MSAANDYHRVGIFVTTEVYVEESGEWLRDDKQSQDTLTVQINKFCENNGVQPIFMSAPNITLVGKSEDGKQRTFRAAVSLIYKSPEVVINGEEDQPRKARPTGDAGFDITAIETISQQLVQSLSSALQQQR